jgi:hypothetical protein
MPRFVAVITAPVARFCVAVVPVVVMVTAP